MEQSAAELRRLRARAELLDIDRRRAIVGAAAHGMTQRSIAADLGATQTTVHRELRRADSVLSETISTPSSAWETVLRFVVGELERDELIERLADEEPGYGSPNDWEDGYVRGGQDDVRLAWMQRLIDDELFEDIRTRRAELHAT